MLFEFYLNIATYKLNSIELNVLNYTIYKFISIHRYMLAFNPWKEEHILNILKFNLKKTPGEGELLNSL